MPAEEKIPCAFSCGRQFKRTDSGIKITEHGAEPEWGRWSVLYKDDEDGTEREYARIRCWLCDAVHYPPSWIVKRIRSSED